MTISREDRIKDANTALTLLLQSLGEQALIERAFDTTADPFRQINTTTWFYLEKKGWTRTHDNRRYSRLTGAGWLKAIRLIGLANDRIFLANVGKLMAALKVVVKGRKGDYQANILDMAKSSTLSPEFIVNIIESHFISEELRKHGVEWYPGYPQSLIWIPVDFGMELLEDDVRGP